MGVFDRMKNVAKGKVSNALGDLERANPEAVYESAIANALARIEEHKSAAAGLAAQRAQLDEKVERLERELVEVRTVLSEALAEDDDDTATVLVARKAEVERAIADAARERDQVAAAVEETKQGLSKLRTEVQALGREKDTALAQLAAAEAAIEIHETNSSVGTSAQARGLESVRSSINVLNARAHEGYLDEEGNSIRGRADALGRKAAEQKAREELERLKRARSGEEEPARASDPPDGGGSVADPEEPSEGASVDPEAAPKRRL